MKVLFEFVADFVSSFIEIVYRLFREKPRLKIEVLECYWENIPENGAQVHFKLNIDNVGDRRTSIKEVRLLTFDEKVAKGQDWVYQTEAQELVETVSGGAYPNSLPSKDLLAHSSIELKGFFNLGKHLEVKDYPLEIEISHTHGTQTIKATAKCIW